MEKNPLRKLNVPIATEEKWLGTQELLDDVLSWFENTFSAIVKREKGYHLLLYGPALSGKTYLVALVLRMAYKKGLSFSYKKAPAFLEQIFRHYTREETSLLREITSPSVFALEDVGREPLSGYAHTKKFIALGLSERKTGMILTTRLSPAEFKSAYGVDLMTDVTKHCILLECPFVPALMKKQSDKKAAWLKGKA